MQRKFKPLQESVDICLKMLQREVNAYDYDPDPDAIEYWTRRIHGYQKIAAEKKIPLRPIEMPTEEIPQ